MKKIEKMTIGGLLLVGLFFWLLASKGEAATINVTCPGQSLQTNGINAAAPGDTISVTGICTENVDVAKSGITINGNTTAEIHGPDNTQPTVKIRAGGVTIENFHSIQGGQDGIMVVGSLGVTILDNTIQSTGRDGIFVSTGGAPTIDGNTIQNTGRYGIIVYVNSFATIIDNTVTNNPNHGILVTDSSDARIGFSSSSDTTASPNIITSNGGTGVHVLRSSNAWIVGNTISNNTNHGINVEEVSHADISDNTINNNGKSGIRVYGSSGVNLGNDTGGTIFDLPNNTSVNNADKGIICALGAYLDGRLGTLNGVNGAIDCNDIGIKTSSLADLPGDYGIDVVTASNGFIRLTNALGNNTTKAARMVVRHYSNAQAPVYLFGSASTATDNFVAFGGGNASANAATQLDLFTASNNTTPVGSPRITIKGNGNVGIGTQTPGNPLQMASGAFVTAGGVWTDASSREYKQNIEGLSGEEAFEALRELNPVKFAYRTDMTEKHVGFIAEEAPDLIATKDRKGLSPMDIVAVLTKVIQEQQKTINELSREVKELKSESALRGAVASVDSHR